MKKKTRRGSRGGRNRKKKPAGAVAEAGDEAEADEVSPAAPRIHVPDFELGDAAEKKPARKRTPAKPKPAAVEDDAQPTEEPAEEVEAVASEDDGAEPAPVKKKTRRGSRGGRNRKKPAAAGVAVAGAAVIESENGAEPAVEEAVPEPVAASGNGAEPATDEYVPMSEWLDDLDA